MASSLAYMRREEQEGVMAIFMIIFFIFRKGGREQDEGGRG